MTTGDAFNPPTGDEAFTFDEVEAAGLDGTLREVGAPKRCYWCHKATGGAGRDVPAAWQVDFAYACNDHAAELSALGYEVEPIGPVEVALTFDSERDDMGAFPWKVADGRTFSHSPDLSSAIGAALRVRGVATLRIDLTGSLFDREQVAR